jgi:hypothetical protein
VFDGDHHLGSLLDKLMLQDLTGLSVLIVGDHEHASGDAGPPRDALGRDRGRTSRSSPSRRLIRPEDVDKIWKAGFSGHWTKPIQSQELERLFVRVFWNRHGGTARSSVSQRATRPL